MLWETATQTLVHRQVSTNNASGVYTYEAISNNNVVLFAGTEYTMSLYCDGTSGAQYYYGSSTQIHPLLTYGRQRFCNSCDSTVFPANTFADFHYGTPDFHFENADTCLTYSISDTSTCGSSYTYGGNVFNSSGRYIVDTLINSASCDSLIILNLTFLNSTSSTISDTACTSYTSPSGKVFTTTNTYMDTIPNTAGCDSIITINLLVNTSSSTIADTVCTSYTSPSGKVFTTTNTYMDTIPNSIGCDSIITIDLVVNNATVVQSGSTLSANLSDTYQWVDCSDNSPISGETNQDFVPTSSGSYAVITTLGVCTDTSSCVDVVVSGINKIESSLFKFYPNPTTDNITIELENLQSKIKVELLNAMGQKIATTYYTNQNNIEVNLGEQKGVYWIRLSTDEVENVSTFKVVKK